MGGSSAVDEAVHPAFVRPRVAGIAGHEDVVVDEEAPVRRLVALEGARHDVEVREVRPGLEVVRPARGVILAGLRQPERRAQAVPLRPEVEHDVLRRVVPVGHGDRIDEGEFPRSGVHDRLVEPGRIAVEDTGGTLLPDSRLGVDAGRGVGERVALPSLEPRREVELAGPGAPRGKGLRLVQGVVAEDEEQRSLVRVAIERPQHMGASVVGARPGRDGADGRSHAAGPGTGRRARGSPDRPGPSIYPTGRGVGRQRGHTEGRTLVRSPALDRESGDARIDRSRVVDDLRVLVPRKHRRVERRDPGAGDVAAILGAEERQRGTERRIGTKLVCAEGKSGPHHEFLDLEPLSAEQEDPLRRLAIRAVDKGPGDLVPEVLPERVPVAGAGDPAAIGLLDIGERQLAAHVPGGGGEVELERFTVLGDGEEQPPVFTKCVREARVAGGQPLGTEGREAVGGEIGRDAAEVALVPSRLLRGLNHGGLNHGGLNRGGLDLTPDLVALDIFEIGIRHRGLRDGRRAPEPVNDIETAAVGIY